MRIEPSHFGNTPLGNPVTRFTLCNDRNVSVGIIDLGAAMQSFMVPDRQGNLGDILLGYNDAQAFWDDTSSMGVVVGRYANRIAHARFTLNGATFDLSKNLGAHHLHGGAIGFGKRMWRATPLEDKDRVSLKLKLDSTDGEEGYPGHVTVTVIYSLNNTDELGITYLAETDRATPINLTSHGYFNLSANHSTTIEDHIVWINADHFLPVDSDCIPTGDISPVADTPFDFRKPTAVGKGIDGDDAQVVAVGGYDHNWVLNDWDGKTKLQAAVHDPKSGRSLEVYTREPGLQFYTANSLSSSLPGKNGRLYQRRQGLCLETQHFPNSPNQPDFPSTILHPGETYRSETVYRFTLKSGLKRF